MNIYEITLYNEKRDTYEKIYVLSKELSNAIKFLDDQGITKNQSIASINKINQTSKVHLIHTSSNELHS